MPIAEDRYLSPEAYLEWEARQPTKDEYVAGETFAMVGVTQRHNRISLNVALALRQGLRDRPSQVSSTEVKLRVAKSAAYYYPDIMVVCGPQHPVAGDQSGVEDPVLIVEVLSPSTEAVDRREKLAAYRGLTSVQEYAPVSQDRPQIEIYRRQGDIGWLHVRYEPGDEVEFAAVKLRAPIAAFYEGTDVLA